VATCYYQLNPKGVVRGSRIHSLHPIKRLVTAHQLLCHSCVTNVVTPNRLVRPGGCFMLVTYGDPSSRLPHLTMPPLDWSVQVGGKFLVV